MFIGITVGALGTDFALCNVKHTKLYFIVLELYNGAKFASIRARIPTLYTT